MECKSSYIRYLNPLEIIETNLKDPWYVFRGRVVPTGGIKQEPPIQQNQPVPPIPPLNLRFGREMFSSLVDARRNDESLP